ncbi:SpoIIAA family protein [Zavarzinella formosa]|uniref:STAS/SEC14 domain-containing protein n=1 Tax=Zavarzinella formosa TaxID=360055 RepID=UPI00030B3453|nr:STAS/SEC14 domain-containing protein [Zavarzinella formosa]
MSVDLHAEAGGKILILNLRDRLTSEDYAHFTPAVEQAVKENGKVRILVRMHDFHGWTLDAVWEDVKFDLRHISHIERLALSAEAGMAVFCKPFTTAKVRYFDQCKTDEAEEWIHGEIAQTSQRK